MDYGEYGRRAKQELKANAARAFPQFVLVSASLVAVAGGLDFFKFCRSMRDGGAEKRWRDLVDGDKSGKDGHAGEPTVIYDVRGRVVATLSSEAVKLKDVAPAVWQAIVATEDHRFFAHAGVDARGLARAVGSLGRRGGGSTITQQLARNLYLSPRRDPSRKLREALITRRLERRLTKNRILELYLSVIELGQGVFGVDAAARHYFGVAVSGISAHQAAMLAATIPSPLRDNPATDTRRFRWRTGLIAGRAF